jgi:hypothetical protein
MKIQTRLLRKTALAAAVTLMVGGVASVSNFVGIETGVSSIVSTAYAAQGDSAGGGQGAMGAGRGGQGGQGAGGQGQRGGGQGQRGGKSVADVLADEADDDSDRPDWAGVPGGEGRPGGGGNPSPGDTKGDIYGDMIMLLRDPVTGLPITSDDGWTYACTDLACSADGAVEMVGGEVPEGTTTYEVDFGRASVARSPSSVIDHALEEALSKLTVEDAIISQDDAGRIVVTVNGVPSTIDSPLENLALYIDLMEGLTGGGSATVDALGSYASLDTAASLLAGVADKTGDIGLDFVMYENLIAGVEADFADFAYTRSFPEDYTYLWAPDTETEPVYRTLNINVYLDVINDPLPAEDEFAALFAAAADDAVEVIELVHTQIVISEQPLPGTVGP